MRTGVDLIEEAVHLLRGCSAADLLPYALGSTPFLIAAVWFVDDRGQPVQPVLPLSIASLIVALLFIWMQCCHAVFARRLRQKLTGAAHSTSSLSWIGVQTAVQPTRLLILPLALLATIPFPWILAFYENLLAAPTGAGLREASADALRSGRYAQRGNWVALGLLSVFALLVFVNVGVLVFLMPQLLRIFTGVETAFSQAGTHAVGNRTFLSVTAALTWFLIDPLIKAVYALHGFYGASHATGADLSAALKRVAAVLVLIAFCSVSLPAQQPITPGDLSQSIDQALKNPQYKWKLGDGHEPGFVEGLLINLQRFATWLADRISDFLDWLFPAKQTFKIEHTPVPKPSSGLAIAAYVLTGVAALAIVYLFWTRTRSRVTVPTAAAIAPVQQDLEDPSLTAADLAEDEWVRLAQQKAAVGDLRLALRALYLGSLSTLGRRGLLSIARGKSNLDYMRELRRRGRGEQSTIDAFERNLSVFERSWYGLHEVTPELFGEFESGFRRMQRHEA